MIMIEPDKMDKKGIEKGIEVPPIKWEHPAPSPKKKHRRRLKKSVAAFLKNIKK